MNARPADGDARFATTRWSVVLAAGECDSPEGRDALEALCKGYWFPLYAFARSSGVNSDDAQDLVQGFFATLLERNYLRQADRERGRFRTFLLAAFRHHVSHIREGERAVKRGGGVRVESLDHAERESRYLAGPASDRTPEQVFERQWALALLERVMAELRTSYGDESGPRRAVFEALRPLLVGGEPTSALADATIALGMTEGAARVALHRMRRRFRDLLRARIAEMVTDPSEIDDEIRHLQAALSA